MPIRHSEDAKVSSALKPKNNYEYFWQLIYNLHRCVRLVVDTGIHYYGWSYDKTFHYMKKNLYFQEQIIKNEIYRYICDPGQAITYKIGELFILDLDKKKLALLFISFENNGLKSNLNMYINNVLISKCITLPNLEITLI